MFLFHSPRGVEEDDFRIFNFFSMFFSRFSSIFLLFFLHPKTSSETSPKTPTNLSQGAYSASKFGLEGLTEVLRREIRLFGIGVTALRPGPVSTDIWNDAEAEADSAGYWSKYSDVEGWGRAMELTRKYLTKEFTKKGWFWPAEKIGDSVVRILKSDEKTGKFDSPAAVVLTPGYLDNWLFPMWLPKHIVDAFVAMKFGVAKVLPRTPFVGGGGGESKKLA